MRLMIIKNSRSLRSLTELSGKLLKADQYYECSGTAAIDLIIRNRPLFISLKIKEPVNGDDNMMTMLGSIDVNTRLRVSVIDTESIKEYFGSFFHWLRNFILPGRNTHKLDTTP